MCKTLCHHSLVAFKHKIDDILNIEKLYKNHDKYNTEVIIIVDSDCDDLPDQDKSSTYFIADKICKMLLTLW